MSIRVKAAGFRKRVSPTRKANPPPAEPSPNGSLNKTPKSTSNSMNSLDQLATARINQNLPRNKRCQLCTDNPVSQWCNGCHRYLCPSCSKAHCRVSACRENQLVTLESMSTRQSYEVQRKQLQVTTTEHKMKQHYEDQLRLFQAQQKRSQQALDAAYTALQQRMEQHFKAQSRKLQQHTARTVDDANERLQQNLKRLKQNSHRLNVVQAQQAESLPRPAGADEPLLDKVNREMNRLGTLPMLPLQPMVIVNHDINHEAFIERRALAVEPLQPINKREKILRHSNLIDCQLDAHSSAGLPNSVQSLLCMGDRLWCLMYDKLHILNIKDSMRAVTVKKDLRGARGMTFTQDRHVIIATLDTGLLLFSPKGKFLNVIDEGRYHDVSFADGTIYAVSKDKNNNVVVHPFKFKDQMWVKIPPIITEQIVQRGHMTIAVHGDNIYVSSTGQDTLYRLGMSGYTQENLLLRTDKLQNVTIQAIDPSGALLILDTRGKHLLVLDPLNEIMAEVELPFLPFQPTAATLSVDGILYLATADSSAHNYRLFMCY